MPSPRRPPAASRPQESGSRSARGAGAGGDTARAPTERAPARAATAASRTSSQISPQRPQPVPLGRQHDMPDVQPPKLARHLLAALALELGEALAHPAVRGIDADP